MRIITRPCPHCGTFITVSVERRRYQRFCAGIGYAQDMCLGPDVTERFITGICPPCWDRLFLEEDEVV